MSEIALEASHLFKVFGKNPRQAVRRLQAGETRMAVRESGNAAVIDASFTVKKGEIFVIMGLSGSGKSTTIRMLNGLLTPTAGTVTIGGRDVTHASDSELRDIRRTSVSMVFQHFALLPHWTVLENTAYGLEIQGVAKGERLERAREIIAKVGLDKSVDARPSELSGGMQQRVGLARALTAGTDILLMDEAFSALDPLIRREMQDQLIELQQELGRTIVFITHDLNEAMLLGDKIAVMRDGRIVQNGTPEEILTDPANDYVAQFVQDVDRARVLTAGAVMEPAHITRVSAGVRSALRTMRENQAASVFVVENRKLLGLVTDRAVVRAIRNGQSDLRSIVEASMLTVTVNDVLGDIVERAVETPVPLAVVDESGRLVGVIPRVTLLAALGNVSSSTSEIPAITSPIAGSAIHIAPGDLAAGSTAPGNPPQADNPPQAANPPQTNNPPQAANPPQTAALRESDKEAH